MRCILSPEQLTRYFMMLFSGLEVKNLQVLLLSMMKIIYIVQQIEKNEAGKAGGEIQVNMRLCVVHQGKHN